jgi:hypothetical protein
MTGRPKALLELTCDETEQLERWVRRGRGPAKHRASPAGAFILPPNINHEWTQGRRYLRPGRPGRTRITIVKWKRLRAWLADWVCVGPHHWETSRRFRTQSTPRRGITLAGNRHGQVTVDFGCPICRCCLTSGAARVAPAGAETPGQPGARSRPPLPVTATPAAVTAPAGADRPIRPIRPTITNPAASAPAPVQHLGQGELDLQHGQLIPVPVVDIPLGERVRQDRQPPRGAVWAAPQPTRRNSLGAYAPRPRENRCGTGY